MTPEEEFTKIINSDLQEDDDYVPFCKTDSVLFGIFDTDLVKEEYAEYFPEDINLDLVRYVVSFVEEQFWIDSHYIHDSELTHVVNDAEFVLPKYLVEEAENMFSVLDQTISFEQIQHDLELAGFRYNEKVTHFLNTGE